MCCRTNAPYSGGNLTDGKFGVEDYTDKNWLGFEKKILLQLLILERNKL